MSPDDKDIARKLPRNVRQDFARRLPTRREMEAHLITKAWKDEAFRKRLVANPATVLESEFPHMLKDGKYPDGVKLTVLEETPEQKYLVLPNMPEHVAKQNLTSMQLASVAAAGACIDATYTDVSPSLTEPNCTQPAGCTNSGCQVTMQTYCTCPADGCEPANDDDAGDADAGDAAAADDAGDAAADAAGDAAADACCCICCL
jgi:hypothetical protein